MFMIPFRISEGFDHHAKQECRPGKPFVTALTEAYCKSGSGPGSRQQF